MAQQGVEENKTEEATPHKLSKARERGQVARGTDLGFFSTMLASAALLLIFGTHLSTLLRNAMAQALLSIPAASGTAQTVSILVAQVSGPAIQIVLLVGFAAALFVALLEVVQLRGLIFSTHPLKPDFSRLNPMQGLKRVFSVRMLKETLKAIAKLGLYAGFSGLAIVLFVSGGHLQVGGAELGQAMYDGLLTLITVFAALALLFTAIDQIIARSEFAKEMRMSRSEFEREHKEHEGEPRQKQKRRQLHAEYAKQTRQLEGLPGSDLLIVNPQHIAVALAYDPGVMEAPKIAAFGRNQFALMLKERAAVLGIPIITDPALARALYSGAEVGQSIHQAQFIPVAHHYLRLREQRNNPEPTHVH